MEMVGIAAIAMIALMFFSGRSNKKRVADAQQKRDEALVPGNWVVTHSRFYGRVVEIDGDVVVLASLVGDETLWDKAAILSAKEPPFAVEDDEDDEDDENLDSEDIESDEAEILNELESDEAEVLDELDSEDAEILDELDPEEDTDRDSSSSDN